MGSLIALILFSLVIVLGFIVEAQARGKVTHATWLPLFWMVICATRSIGQWINIGGAGSINEYANNNLSGSLVDQVVLLSVIALGLIILFRRKDTLIRLIKYNKPLLIFTFYLGLTAIWSDIEEVSFRRWIRLFGNLVMAGVLMSEPDPAESVRSVFLRCAYLLIPLSVLLVKYFPQIGIIYSAAQGGQIWVGAALMKNGLGHLSFVSLFFLCWETIIAWGRKIERKYPRAIFDFVILVMAFWLLKGSGDSSSSAAKGCLVVGMALLILSRVTFVKRNFKAIGVSVLLGAGFFLVAESSFGIVEAIVAFMGRDMTFTDRVPLWHALVDLGMQKPLLGYGYEGFWIGERSLIEGLSQAHNGYLEVFLEGGLVAIALLGTLLISVLRNIYRSILSDYEYAVFRLCFFAMILLANVPESSLARERELLSFIFFVIAMNDGVNFPRFRGHLVKPPPSSLRTRPRKNEGQVEVTSEKLTRELNTTLLSLRKPPRQGDTSGGELLVSSWGRYMAGGRSANASCGRSSL